MNPVFVLLVIVLAVFLWFLLAFTFPWLGKILYRLYDDAREEINKGEIKKSKDADEINNN